MKESEIQKAIKDYLTLKGWLVIKFNNGGFWSKDGKRFIPPAQLGVADLLCCAPNGRFVALEIKTPKGELSTYQERFLDDVKANNAVGMVLRSLDDAINLVEAYEIHEAEHKKSLGK